MKGRYEDENLTWIPILIVGIFLLPFILKGLTYSYKYYLFVLNMAGIYIILTVGLDLLSGYTGLISLGHAAFLAIGSYTSAILVDQVGIPFVFWGSLAGRGFSPISGLHHANGVKQQS